MSGKLVIMLLSFATVSCVTHQASQINAPQSTQDRLGSAVVSPLSDLNLVQTEIPPVLNSAVSNPYEIPEDNSCAGLTKLIQTLDAALGPDMDALSTTDAKSALEKGSDFAENEAVGSVERTIQGVVPFRSWIRRLSGAEKRSRDLRTAVAAGVVRRAFLKGMGQEQGCDAPASPLKRPPATESVEPAATPGTDK